MKTETKTNQRSSERRAELAPAMPSRDGGRRIAKMISALTATGLGGAVRRATAFTVTRAAMLLLVMLFTSMTTCATEISTITVGGWSIHC